MREDDEQFASIGRSLLGEILSLASNILPVSVCENLKVRQVDQSRGVCSFV